MNNNFGMNNAGDNSSNSSNNCFRWYQDQTQANDRGQRQHADQPQFPQTSPNSYQNNQDYPFVSHPYDQNAEMLYPAMLSARSDGNWSFSDSLSNTNHHQHLPHIPTLRLPDCDASSTASWGPVNTAGSHSQSPHSNPPQASWPATSLGSPNTEYHHSQVSSDCGDYQRYEAPVASPVAVTEETSSQPVLFLGISGQFQEPNPAPAPAGPGSDFHRDCMDDHSTLVGYQPTISPSDLTPTCITPSSSYYALAHLAPTQNQFDVTHLNPRPSPSNDASAASPQPPTSPTNPRPENLRLDMPNPPCNKGRGGEFLCLLQPYFNCTQHFTKASQARRHAQQVHILHKYWLCTTGDCSLHNANRHKTLFLRPGLKGKVFARKDNFKAHIKAVHGVQDCMEQRRLATAAKVLRCPLPTSIACPAPGCDTVCNESKPLSDLFTHIAKDHPRDMGTIGNNWEDTIFQYLLEYKILVMQDNVVRGGTYDDIPPGGLFQS